MSGAHGSADAASSRLSWLDRLPRVSDRLYRAVTLATLVSILVLIGSGGWVRLSESGLGCPTWPSCYGSGLVAHDSYHALVEFVNRCIITAVAVLIAFAIVGAVLAHRRRRDVVWLSVGLFVGYVAEAVLGGFTVLFKLAPELVAAHLVVAMVLLTDAVVLHWLVRRGTAAPRPPTGRDVRLLARVLLVVLAVVVILGTVATGSGPHAGSKGTARLPFRFAATAELHAVVVMFLLGLLVAMFFALRGDHATPELMRSYEAVLAAGILQGVVGYTQYFSGLPIDLVEIHIVGAGVLVIAMVRFNLAVGRRPGAPHRPAGDPPIEHAVDAPDAAAGSTHR